MTHSGIIHFIDGFKVRHPDEIIELFTCGYCYQFSLILHSRFPDSFIVYSPESNHFACLIEKNVYDITGKISDKKATEYWVWDRFCFYEPEQAKRIIRYCIKKEE